MTGSTRSVSLRERRDARFDTRQWRQDRKRRMVSVGLGGVRLVARDVCLSCPCLRPSARDGVRLGQATNGQALTDTLDQAAPLVVVLCTRPG